MDYKEKYEEAYKLYHSEETTKDQRYVLESLFPELKESEDDRIRNRIKDVILSFDSLYLQENFFLSKNDAIAWLEKQGEQKLAEWSEEDENLFMCAIDAVKQESKVRTDGCLDEEVGEMVTNWLKSLKDRVLTQPK